MTRLLICCSLLIANTAICNGWEKILHTYDESFSKVYFLNPDTGFVIGYNYQFSAGIVLKTTDGGETWVRKTVVQGNVNDIQFLNDTVGYIAGRDGFVKRTTDCGIIWSNMYDCYDLNDIYGMHFFSADSSILVKFTKIVQANSINQPPCIDSIVSSFRSRKNHKNITP